MSQTKYGIISDVHADPRIVPLAVAVLNQLGAEKLIVNGDISSHEDTREQSQAYTAFILDAIGKSGLESFVQPGSHESLTLYQPVIEYFAEKYSNIINVLRNPKITRENHDLVFLPGSDFLCGGDYSLGNMLPTGLWLRINDHNQAIKLESLEEANNYLKMLKKVDFFSIFYNQNPQDLKTLVTSPEKTIVVCHIPRKFDKPETPDVAEFGEATCNFMFEGDLINKGAILPLQGAKYIVSKGYQIEVQIRKENRGNQQLKAIYEEVGITKAVSGHFHESGHKACDRKGNSIAQNTPVQELFWNTGFLSGGETGILTVDGETVSYQNVNLRDYLK